MSPKRDRLMLTKRRQGQVLPLIAIALPVLIGLAGLSMTVGTVYFGQEKLQNAVDAAALAGAQVMSRVGRSALRTQAALVRKNDASAKHVVLKPQTTPPNTVLAQAQAEVPGTFAALFGIQTFTVKARAGATYGAGQPFNYAVFQGDTHTQDPSLVIHGKNSISPVSGTGSANVHSNNGLTLHGDAHVQGSCSASGQLTDHRANCSQGQTSGVPPIAMPNWSIRTLTRQATVIGSVQNPKGYTFHGTGQFSRKFGGLWPRQNLGGYRGSWVYCGHRREHYH